MVSVGHSRSRRRIGRSRLNRKVANVSNTDERKLEQDLRRQIGEEQSAADGYIATKKLAKKVRRKDVVKALDHIAPDELEHKQMLKDLVE